MIIIERGYSGETRLTCFDKLGMNGESRFSMILSFVLS